MIKKARTLIRSYFGFSKTETNGFLVLIPVMAFLLFVPKIYVQVFSSTYDSYVEDRQLLDSLVTAWNANVIEPKKSKKIVLGRRGINVELRNFDPNHTSVPQLCSLGISLEVANRIRNYRQKGGSFRIKADLTKIYGLSDSLYQVLEPYILLPDQKKYTKTKPNDIKKSFKEEKYGKSKGEKQAPLKKTFIAKKNFLKIDINQADTSQLMQLKGVGRTLSQRVIKYRKLLGGYIEVKQLGEVYGLSDSLVVSLEHQLFIGKIFEPEKIELNLATFKELNSHPYISYEQTKDILNTKSKYGKFKKTEDLQRLNTFTESELERLIPYLKY